MGPLHLFHDPLAPQLTTARAVILGFRAIPPKINSRNPIMNSMSDVSFASHGNALARELSLDAVRHRAPAVFAASAHERMSPRYTFIPKCGRPHIEINVATDYMWRRPAAGLFSAWFAPVSAT